MALARVLRFLRDVCSPVPSLQPAMHQTLTNEKHYIKMKIRQFTEQGKRRDWRVLFLIRPSVCAEMNLWKYANSHFMCDANVNMSCAEQDGGWQRCRKDLCFEWVGGKTQIEKELQTHGAQLGLLDAGLSRRLHLEMLLHATRIRFWIHFCFFVYLWLSTRMKCTQTVSMNSSVTASRKQLVWCWTWEMRMEKRGI